MRKNIAFFCSTDVSVPVAFLSVSKVKEELVHVGCVVCLNSSVATAIENSGKQAGVSGGFDRRIVSMSPSVALTEGQKWRVILFFQFPNPCFELPNLNTQLFVFDSECLHGISGNIVL